MTAGRASGGPIGGLLADSVGWRWSALSLSKMLFSVDISIQVVSRTMPTDRTVCHLDMVVHPKPGTRHD
jgi:predicted MFS family arabinose efflux permease